MAWRVTNDGELGAGRTCMLADPPYVLFAFLRRFGRVFETTEESNRFRSEILLLDVVRFKTEAHGYSTTKQLSEGEWKAKRLPNQSYHDWALLRCWYSNQPLRPTGTDGGLYDT